MSPPPTTDDHPRVYFQQRGADPEANLAFGFLSIIAGVPWLAETREQAHSKTVLFQLDPQLLVEQTNSETDAPEFVYQGVLTGFRRAE